MLTPVAMIHNPCNNTQPLKSLWNCEIITYEDIAIMYALDHSLNVHPGIHVKTCLEQGWICLGIIITFDYSL